MTVIRWRAGQDSNPQPRDSKSLALSGCATGAHESHYTPLSPLKEKEGRSPLKRRKGDYPNFPNSFSSALTTISWLSALASFPKMPSRRVCSLSSKPRRKESSASPFSLSAPSRPLSRRQSPEANISESKTLILAFDSPRESPRALKEKRPSSPLTFPMPRRTRRLVDASILLLAARAALLLAFPIRLEQGLPLVAASAAWPFAPYPIDDPQDYDEGEEAKYDGKEEIGDPS